MTLGDYVWISIGQFTLAATFALGILVGVSLATKGQRNGDCNTGTEDDDNSGHVIATLGAGRRAAGGPGTTR